jgi:hypothetical protein
VSTWEPDPATEWGGRPVARKIADAVPRGRVIATGTIRDTATVSVGGTRSCSSVLDDGSSRVVLLFVGRPTIPGMVSGARCSIEGTARVQGGRLVVWNPLYRFEQPDPAERDEW